MFICGLCHRQSKPGESATRVVLLWRAKTYPFRPQANVYQRNGITKITNDNGGEGMERVSEVLAHAACAALHVEVAEPRVRHA